MTPVLLACSYTVASWEELGFINPGIIQLCNRAEIVYVFVGVPRFKYEISSSLQA